MSIQVEKPWSILTTTKEYIDQFQKENVALKQLLTQRNKIIEQSGIELDRLRVNLLKMQEQNKRLALQNTQMLADLNSGKDRLKALQHEIGCKNGMLKALKLEFEAKELTRTCKHVDIKSMQCPKEGKPCNTKRSSQSNNSGSPNEVQPKEIVVNKRSCMRRQSSRFKAIDLNPAEDMLEIYDVSLPPRPSQKGSTSMNVPVKNEDIKCHGEDKPCNTKRSLQSNNPGSLNEVQPKENAVNKRPYVRRQSARLKAIDLNLAENLLEINDGSLPPYPSADGSGPQKGSTSMNVSVINENNEQNSEEKPKNKRSLVTKHSAKLKVTELKPAEDSFEINDVIVPPCTSSSEPVTQKGSTSDNETIKNEENDCSSGGLVYESKEFGRSSLSRPSRVAAKKVQSYKEIPLNLKMRRPQ